MSHDPSRVVYTHSCGVDPCICTYDHKPLDIKVIECTLCDDVFYTMNKLYIHMSDKHPLPLDFKAKHVNVTLNGQV